MMNYYWGDYYQFFPAMLAVKAFFMPLAILDLVLKGFALYKSARRGETYWFIALLIVNSLGILPGIYLLLNRQETTKVSSPKPKSKKK